jgi:hypothetical protein
MTNVPEEKLAETAAYAALQAARTACNAEAPNTPEKHAAGMEVAYCMRDCLLELGSLAASMIPERPA